MTQAPAQTQPDSQAFNEERPLEDHVVKIYRCAKVVKGGRRFRFGVLVIVGDRHGHVGVGYGKANEVPVAVDKGIKNARKQIFDVNLAGHTIPHRVQARYGASKVVLLPASEGTGVIAGVHLRPLLELAGIRALMSLRTREAVARLRGVQVL